jgi:arylsulfatase A-like enzyme/Tfp pilus assembly protein PilF
MPMGRRRVPVAAALAAVVLVWACARERPATPEPLAEGPRPSVLLATLDTTRADVMSDELMPSLARLAKRGTSFRHAYATAPLTLPSHASMFTGLYPYEHGIHENGRPLSAGHAVVAERLRGLGYRAAAFVSAFMLDRQFGLSRGFESYDDQLPQGLERAARETTDRAIRWLRASRGPVFLWVHYYDPHAPHAPPEPFRSRFANDPYRGEVAYVDQELARLLATFERRAGKRGWRALVVGDHGEGLGEHGEEQHGNLLYQATMRVPLVLAGDAVPAGEVAAPVSARRVYDTVLAWAGLPAPRPLPVATATAPPATTPQLRRRAGGGEEAPAGEPVLGEAMQPFLSFGWQPQVMVVDGRLKVIRSGETEVYDVVADPGETHDLAGGAAVASLGRAAREALRAYPLPGPPSDAERPAQEETRDRLASLGYAASFGSPRRRTDAPSPRRMTHLFIDLDLASRLFGAGDYAAAVPVFERIVAADPHNPMAAVYVAVAHSMLDHDAEAQRWFRRATAVAPDSPDLRHYQAMHECKNERWERAEPLLASVLAQEPDRLPALVCLAEVRAQQGRRAEAIALLERAVTKKGAPAAELVRLGELRMAGGETTAAIAAFERARALQGERFGADLELGVLYLAARRLADARTSLDRALAAEPGEPMALFKRAQVSVLLGEPDRGERARRALAAADATTRPLVEREPLVRGLL